MSDQNDDSQNYALFLAAAIVFGVVAGVIGLAASHAGGKAPPASPTQAAVAAPTTQADRVYFEVGSAVLPPEAVDLLVHLAEAARASGQSVVISGFHDATGDPGRNEALAKERALAVHHALEANGVTPDRLVMSKPAMTTGDGDPREARRVELRLQ